MKKLIYLFIGLLLLTSCNSETSKTPQNSGRQHIFHTYYGDIDIDTMEVVMMDSGVPCYMVKYIEKDSFIWDGTVKYLPSPVQILYAPLKDKYFKLAPEYGTGQWSVYDFDPSFDYYYWLKK